MKPSDVHFFTQLTKISKFVTKLTNFLGSSSNLRNVFVKYFMNNIVPLNLS